MKYQYTIVGDENGYKQQLIIDGKVIHEVEMVSAPLGLRSTKPINLDDNEDITDELYDLIGEIDVGHNLYYYATSES